MQRFVLAPKDESSQLTIFPSIDAWKILQIRNSDLRKFSTKNFWFSLESSKHF